MPEELSAGDLNAKQVTLRLIEYDEGEMEGEAVKLKVLEYPAREGSKALGAIWATEVQYGISGHGDTERELLESVHRNVIGNSFDPFGNRPFGPFTPEHAEAARSWCKPKFADAFDEATPHRTFYLGGCHSDSDVMKFEVDWRKAPEWWLSLLAQR